MHIINRLFAEQFEQSIMVDVPNVRLLMESKILHEMVHWGYTSIHERLDPPEPEREWAFEREAYGRELTATSLGLQDFVSIPGNQ